MSLFCDGACPGNGRATAIGGWAWAYWPGPVASQEPATYKSAKLSTTEYPATNQRAELMALLESLRWIQSHIELPHVIVYTDSVYAMKCASVWGPGWKSRNWTRPTGGPLQNLDIIQPLVNTWEIVRDHVKLQHVRGHQKGTRAEAWGNNWVDRAAVAGAQGTAI
jgi:ribonuclease HI